MKKLLLVFVLLLITTSLVSAVKPTQIIDSGCEIRSPQVTVIKQNEGVTSHLHVINLTTGSFSRLTNDTTVCYAHLYDTTSHLLAQNYTGDSNGLEFTLDIDKGNFSKIGDFHFYIECVSTDSICGVSGMFQVTTNGVELTTQRAIIYVGLLGILIFLFIANIGLIQLLPQGNTRDEEGKVININNLKHLRTVLWILAYGLVMTIMFISSNIAFAYLDSTLMANMFLTIYKVMFYFLLPFTTILFVWIIFKIFDDNQMKRMLERGVEIGGEP